ncbi:MerR family transcriptional regulator [Gimibacter soli]|jgi:Cu(I)-responsive transcriptional regulator|uniref:Helix-turn-helix domain-containing protein n=1 Tax=Gimibacter soli TaxID=3024400 RepID=A0AAE9XL45_9PROT|nr:helix-turn-helix domain-containing protein [Gimibacter soli]WCL52898.1 helix-turn-helix domain-containing protein [Gimibacter soli]
MAQDFMIGELAKRTDTKVQTIRYYEEIGVMPKAIRTTNNRRVYNEIHLERLTFIRHSRELGFSLDDIRNLLEFSDQPDRPCEEVDAIARAHLKRVDRKIAALEVMQTELKRMINHCSGGTISDCRIIKVLADHSLCQEHG